MSKLIDLTGKRFGLLTVLNRSTEKAVRVKWQCHCECGNEIVVEGQHLRSGATISCGCYHKDELSKRRMQHGYSKTRLYSIWYGMKCRCSMPSHSTYTYYGGRGISVCAEWLDFIKFQEWALANGYTDGLEIDRINNDSDYAPDNCRWVTHAENMKNLRCQKGKNSNVKRRL